MVIMYCIPTVPVPKDCSTSRIDNLSIKPCVGDRSGYSNTPESSGSKAPSVNLKSTNPLSTPSNKTSSFTTPVKSKMFSDAGSYFFLYLIDYQVACMYVF